MAELHVQRKEPNIWPWVLGGLLLLALILWFVFGRGDGQVGRMADQADSTMQSAPMMGQQGTGTQQRSAAGQLDDVSGPVSQFVQFAEQGAAAQASQSHEYIANGLRQLAGALRDITGDEASGVLVRPRLDEIEQRADDLQRDPTSTGHALKAREAFLMAASLMGQMQNEVEAASATSVQNAMTAAEAISPNALLLEQTTEIQRFFDQAAVAVRALAEGRATRGRM
jgi:hypothetical protein